MKKFVFIILTLVVAIYLFGCGKKEAAIDESQEQMSMDTVVTDVKTTPEAQAPVLPVAPVVVTAKTPEKVEALPPSGPYKPTIQEVQTALTHAGLYTGKIDGKSGPMTKKAIEEFQKANGLKADGKVGPKTWALLSAHLLSAESNTQKR
ncbi:MAG: peptidoglycan-binding protein [Candidatus Omnitrophica bacterium]|nr:peptidoglycan-binding protein [Candidatus Omnitrophota bacterium]